MSYKGSSIKRQTPKSVTKKIKDPFRGDGAKENKKLKVGGTEKVKTGGKSLLVETQIPWISFPSLFNLFYPLDVDDKNGDEEE